MKGNEKARRLTEHIWLRAFGTTPKSTTGWLNFRYAQRYLPLQTGKEEEEYREIIPISKYMNQ